MEPTVFVCLAAARALRLTRSRPPSPPRRGNVAGAVEGAAEGAAEGAVGLLPPPKRLKRRGGLVVVAFALAGGSAGSDRVEGALGGGGASCGDLAGGGCCSPWLSPACRLPFSPPDRVGLAWPSTPAPADPPLLDASADAQETLGWGEEGLYAVGCFPSAGGEDESLCAALLSCGEAGRSGERHLALLPLPPGVSRVREMPPPAAAVARGGDLDFGRGGGCSLGPGCSFG